MPSLKGAQRLRPAVAALGIPATRSLALLTLAPEDLVVVRENGPEPTSLLARLAPSFIRIGHFEAMNPSEQARNFSQIFFGGGWARGGMLDEADGEGPLGGQGNLEGLRDLVEFSKGIIGYTGDTKGWAKEVVRRNASMVAGWQVSGGTSLRSFCNNDHRRRDACVEQPPAQPPA